MRTLAPSQPGKAPDHLTDHPTDHSDMATDTLTSLFGQKAWANRELFALLATLPEQHAAPLHTCIRTLNHIVVVDQLFRARLSGAPAPFDATNTKATPSLEQLRLDVAATDAWYLDHVASTSAAQASDSPDSHAASAEARALRSRRTSGLSKGTGAMPLAVSALASFSVSSTSTATLLPPLR